MNAYKYNLNSVFKEKINIILIEYINNIMTHSKICIRG